MGLPIDWKLFGKPFPQRSTDLATTPQIQGDYLFNVVGNYPEASRKMAQEGDCVIHTSIDADGTPGKFSISKSTGFATLDQACIVAIQQARFTPARDNGSAVTASTDIRISWRLPPQ
jgi:periplasmic protein TonB